MKQNPSFELAEQAFFRATGTRSVPGNRVRLLRDASENYPAWMKAIRAARRWVHFETYIIFDDDIGRQFATLLAEKAREGIHVRLLYDWFGSLGRAPRRFWRQLRDSGVEVRCFNPPSFDSAFSWISRNHRKMLSVDGRVAFVSGLCVGQHWAGYPEKNIAPWRDTGVEIEGPAVRDVDQAFAEDWKFAGGDPDPLEVLLSDRQAGHVSMRVVPTVPLAGNLYRLDHLMTTLARRSIWLSDAYFAGTSPYVHALQAAARAGVDVRLLIPGTNNIPVIRAISRAGLRPLLESGVRVFEWCGPMMHAKTAVVDGTWARVGSTNLNLSSWIGNWELDVLIDDERFAQEMQAMYLSDLQYSTEIVLEQGWRKPIAPKGARISQATLAGGASRTAAGMIRLGRAVGAAVTRRRELGPAEAVIMLWGAALLIAVSVVLILWPRVLTFPAAALCLWVAVTLVLRSWRLKKTRRPSVSLTKEIQDRNRHAREQ